LRVNNFQNIRFAVAVAEHRQAKAFCAELRRSFEAREFARSRLGFMDRD